MGRLIGIWINNKKAMIVSLEKGQEHHETYESRATRHVRLAGEPKGMSQSKVDDSKYQTELQTYYKEVLEIIKDSKSIFLFGPGEAKEKLKKAFLNSGEPGAKIVGMETVDKMTENQIVAKVKEHFFPKKTAEQAH